MTHNGKIIDKDPYFSIDPTSRAITNESTSKVNIIQFDHNSERFSFSIPRHIEGHDMYECNLVRVHYANIDSATSEQTLGVYRVDDMEIDDDNVNFSWLLSQNVTQHSGKLEFLVEFACVIDEKVEYSWHTGIFNGITVAQGMNYNDVPAVEYPDILVGLISITDALPTTYADINLSNVSNEAFSQKMSEAGGGLAGEGGAFKRIGFTSDCDYIATSSNGKTAFENAIADASDGDVILVMGGEYTGTATVTITKDLTFIGIDRPIIKFNIAIPGGGEFSYENWSWTYVYEPKHGKFYGFIFDGQFSVGGEANPDGETYHGYVTAVDCVFNGITQLYGGDSVRCEFWNEITSGHYFGSGCEYSDCVFIGNVTMQSGEDKLIRCEFYPTTEEMGHLSAYSNDSDPQLRGCKIYAPGKNLSVYDAHGSGLNLYDTLIFANGFSEGYGNSISGGYLMQMTAK